MRKVRYRDWETLISFFLISVLIVVLFVPFSSPNNSNYFEVTKTDSGYSRIVKLVPESWPAWKVGYIEGTVVYNDGWSCNEFFCESNKANSFLRVNLEYEIDSFALSYHSNTPLDIKIYNERTKPIHEVVSPNMQIETAILTLPFSDTIDVKLFLLKFILVISCIAYGLWRVLFASSDQRDSK